MAATPLARWTQRTRELLRTEWAAGLAVLFIAQVTAELAFQFALPFIPLYVQDLGVHDVTEAGLWAGAMAGGFAIAMGIMGPVWGALSDRFGRRVMVQRAMFGAGVMIGAMGLARTPQQLLALRVAQGTLTGVVSATTTMVSLMVPPRHLGSALGLMYAAQFTGGSLGPLIGGVVADHYGYRLTFGSTAAIFVIAGVLVTAFVKEPPRAAARKREDASALPGAAERDRILSRPLLAVVALTAVIRLANLAPQPVLPLFVQQLGAAPEHVAATVGLVLAISGVAATASALLVGRLADRYGRGATLLVCLVGAAAISPLHAAATSVWQLLVLRTLVGLLLGGMSPAVQAVLTEITPPHRRGAAFGLLATAGAVGNGAGPVLGSAVAAAWGIPATFIVTAPVFLACALVVAGLRLPRASSAR